MFFKSLILLKNNSVLNQQMNKILGSFLKEHSYYFEHLLLLISISAN